MTTPRTAFKINPHHPDSDAAAEMASGRGLQGVQALRLHVLGPAAAAREAELFTLTDTFRTRYDGSLQGSRKFYPSASGYQDELLWAAAWLYEATGEAGYLQCISQNAEAFGGVD
jgi:endoglucanase